MTRKQKLAALESRDAELARLNAALEKLDAEILSAGKKLSAAREKSFRSSPRPSANSSRDLGFKQSKFDVALASNSESFKFQISNSAERFRRR